jgi:hypothetical protein
LVFRFVLLATPPEAKQFFEENQNSVYKNIEKHKQYLEK